jgi:hypothetical protein
MQQQQQVTSGSTTPKGGASGKGFDGTTPGGVSDKISTVDDGEKSAILRPQGRTTTLC